MKGQGRRKESGVSRKGSSRRDVGRSWAPWALLGLGSLGLGSFLAPLPPFQPLHHWAPGGMGLSWVLGLAGFLLIAAAFFTGKEGGRPFPDFSPLPARMWLILILGFGVVLRLWHWREPHPTWGYDPFWELMEARDSAELGKHSLMFQLGGREPLFHYLLVFLWRVVPEASPYAVSRVGSVLLDALAIWGLYLLGREAGGRRVGLLAAALGAASKPMMIMTLACTRGVAVTAAAAFLLLFTLRLFKRPDIRHYLQWGAMLGVSLYTYTGVRVLWLWVVLSVLVFSWWKSREGLGLPPRARGGGRWTLTAAALAGGIWLSLGYLKAHGAIGLKYGWLGTLGTGPIQAGFFLLAFFAFSFLQWGPVRGPALKGWFLGTFTAVFLALPLVLHQEFARHLGNDSIFSHHGEKAWGHLADKVGSLFASLFLGGPGAVDRYDLNILGDAQLDLFSIPVVLLGLAFWAACQGWTPTWLLAAGTGGILPMLLSADPHSVKLLPGLPALLVLGALALGRVWDGFRSAFPWKAVGTLGTMFLTGVWVFGAFHLYGRIWGPFASQRDPNMASASVALKEPLERRIYFAQVGDFFLDHQQNILMDGREAHSLREVNPIDLAEGEEVPGAVILFPADDEYEEARPVREKLSRHFPGTPWKEFSGPGWSRRLLRLELSPAQVEKAYGFFRVREAQGESWRRVFLRRVYGLARGGYVTMDERVPFPHAPAPEGPGFETCRVTGDLTLSVAGQVEFSVEGPSWLRLEAGGKKVLHHRPSRGSSRGPMVTRARVRLGAGKHEVELWVHRREPGMPEVLVRLPGQEAPIPLGQTQVQVSGKR